MLILPQNIFQLSLLTLTITRGIIFQLLRVQPTLLVSVIASPIGRIQAYHM